jgi:hypothetical protein
LGEASSRIAAALLLDWSRCAADVDRACGLGTWALDLGDMGEVQHSHCYRVVPPQFRSESPDHSCCSCVEREEVVLCTPCLGELVNSLFVLCPESSEAFAKSLFEIDRQEARHQRCSGRQHLADSWLGGRNWCSLARNYGRLVRSTLPYSVKRYQMPKQPSGYRYVTKNPMHCKGWPADLRVAARLRGGLRCLRWVCEVESGPVNSFRACRVGFCTDCKISSYEAGVEAFACEIVIRVE